MAERGGVSWYIKMLLDKRSAERVKKEAEAALRDGTAPGPARRNLSVVEAGFDKVRGAASKLRGMIFSVQGMLASIGLGIGAAAVTKFLVDTNRQFQSLLAQLKVLEGSESGARAVFNAIEDFASRTPFSIEQLTEAYIRLRTAGIQPTEEMLTSFGDLASARSQSILDFAMAVEDAVTGEMERLKQFGIKAKQEGEQVSFTFNEQTTVVRNTQSAIVEYLESVGQAAVVQGSMQEQMSTLNGVISNLWDNLGTLARTIGESGGVNEMIGNAASEVAELTARVNENSGTIAAWTRLLLATGGAVVQSFVFPIRVAWNAITSILRVAGAAFTTFGWGISKAGEFILDQAANIADALGQDGMAATLRGWADAQASSAERFAEANRSMWEGVEKDGRDSISALENLGQSYRNLAGSIAQVADQQERAARAASWGTGGGGGGAPTGGSETGGAGPASPTAGLAGIGRPGVGQIITKANWIPPKSAVSEWDQAMEGLRQNAWATAGSMTSAFEGLFTAMFTGFDKSRDGFHSLADAAKGIGAAVVSSLSEGWAMYAMGRGTAALAEGTWPPNPAAMWSATKWFSAAGMFRALGATLAGAGQRAGVGGGVGAPSAVGRSERASEPERNIYIYVDGIDPRNPHHQDLIHVADAEAKRRWGKNARPNASMIRRRY